jgi:hypothetical protein
MLRDQAWLVFLGWLVVVSAAYEAPDLAGLHPLNSGSVFKAIGATRARARARTLQPSLNRHQLR